MGEVEQPQQYRFQHLHSLKVKVPGTERYVGLVGHSSSSVWWDNCHSTSLNIITVRWCKSTWSWVSTVGLVGHSSSGVREATTVTVQVSTSSQFDGGKVPGVG